MRANRSGDHTAWAKTRRAPLCSKAVKMPEFARSEPFEGASQLSFFVYPTRRETTMSVLVVYISAIVILGGAAFAMCWGGEYLDKKLHGDH